MIKAYTQCSLEAQFTSDQQIVVSYTAAVLCLLLLLRVSHICSIYHMSARHLDQDNNLIWGEGMLLRLIWIYIQGTRWTLCLMTQYSMRKYKKGLVNHQDRGNKLAHDKTNVKRVSEDQRLWLGQGFPQRVTVLHRSRHFLAAESSQYERYVLCAIFSRSANLPTKHVFSAAHVSAVVTFHGL